MSNAAESIDPSKKPETFLHTVEVDITSEETTARTQRLLEVLNKIDTTEADKASRVSDFNGELKQLRKEAGKIRQSIRIGKERRDVECYEQPDFRRNIVFIVRAEDNKVIDERAMTLEDREQELPLNKGKADTDPANEGDDKPATEPKAAGAGKVTRLKASDVKKRKAQRDAKAAADKAREAADAHDEENASDADAS
jgi:hypothetical protein